MTRKSRGEVFDPYSVGTYHVFNRVVRRSLLFGKDPISGNDYTHRKLIVLNRLRSLSHHFSIDVFAFAIMSNHFHLIVRNRPDVANNLGDREVVIRWLMICPLERDREGNPIPATEPQIQAVLSNPETVSRLRLRLSNPSWLMSLLCQHISRRCNKEDGCTGRFFEERFKMIALLDEPAVIACMAYVDLNPLRAGLSDNLYDYKEVSLALRLETLSGEKVDTASWLAPIALTSEPNCQSGTANYHSHSLVGPSLISPTQHRSDARGCLSITLPEYVAMLTWLASQSRPELTADLKANALGELVLKRQGLDPAALLCILDGYTKHFFSAMGCSASITRETSRRKRNRMKAPGRHLLDTVASPAKPAPAPTESN
jgi:hypothetical protein